MDKVRTLLSANVSINSRTQGELSERHLPGKGETATVKLSSAHCQGGLRSAGFHASLAAFCTKFKPTINRLVAS